MAKGVKTQIVLDADVIIHFSGKKCYQLYRDNLDNFSINNER